MRFRFRLFAFGVMVPFFWPLGPLEAQSKPLPYSYDRFSDFRHKILELIGGAKRQVLLTTSLFTDGEIVTALYLAKYRGVAVKVFLGHEKANNYLSRLHYLKRQKIDTYLTDKSFPNQDGTVLIIDRQVFVSENPLDFKAQSMTYALMQPTQRQIVGIVKSLQSALKSPKPAIPIPLPRVRKKARRGRIFSPPLQVQGREKAVGKGGYNYDHNSSGKKIPDGLPTALPSKTKYQLNQIEKVESALDAEK